MEKNKALKHRIEQAERFRQLRKKEYTRRSFLAWLWRHKYKVFFFVVMKAVTGVLLTALFLRNLVNKF